MLVQAKQKNISVFRGTQGIVFDMKILLLNLGLYGSTGTIVLDLKKKIEENGDEAVLAYPEVSINRKGYENDIVIKGVLSRKLNHFLEKVTGFQGCFSWFKTRKMLREIKHFSPDIIHLHNLHKININLGMLFRFIKKEEIPAVWTLHDCWAFTGQCPYFTMIKCEKWKTECFDCPQYRKYPEVYVDRTRQMYRLKRKWFTDVHNMTIITPSYWLAGLVKKSYLKEYPIKVIHNGIDRNVFKVSENGFREKYHITGKYMILGVAAQWDKRKGLDVFLTLAERLDTNYVIVLVGTNKNVDKLLPENIISIHATFNRTELAAIYSAADVFVNPTREENFPTVNIEALACGTPVITFDTGGSPESLDESCGRVIPCDNIDTMENVIRDVCIESKIKKEDCLKRSSGFDKNLQYQNYINLYKQILF